MSTTLFEDFVNAELPLRIGTVEVTPPSAGELPAYKGVGLLTEHKTLAQLNISSTQNLSTDGTFASPSGTTYPSTLAVKTLVDARTAGLLELCSASYDASSNLYPSTGGSGVAGAIMKGDVFFIGTGGVLGGVIVNTGDGVVALVDSPAQTASNWDVFESNLGYTPENIANKSVDGTLSANSDTLYPSQKAVKTYADTKQSSDATLTALAAFNTNGILVQTAADTFAGRSFADSSDITWTNPAGTAGNFSAALVATGVSAGTYGSASLVPIITFGADGRATGASTVALNGANVKVFTSSTSLALAVKTDYIVTTLASNASYTLPNTPAAGDNITVYIGNTPAGNTITFLRNGSTINGTASDVSGVHACKVELTYTGTTWALVRIPIRGNSYNSTNTYGTHGTVSGGTSNAASGNYGFIGGGTTNTVSVAYGVVCGGESNSVNTAGSGYCFIGGGKSNVVLANYGVVTGGSDNNVGAVYSGVGSGYGNTFPVSTGTYSFIGGGSGNTISSSGAFIGGGATNTIAASANGAVICGGTSNQASAGTDAVVVAGTGNNSSGARAGIVTGQSMTASGTNAGVLTGASGTASGVQAAHLNGSSTEAFGDLAVVRGVSTTTSDKEAAVLRAAKTTFTGTGASQTVSSMTSPAKLAAYNSTYLQLSVHNIKVLMLGRGSSVNNRLFLERRVLCFTDNTGTLSILQDLTVGTDVVGSGITFTSCTAVISGSTVKLDIVATFPANVFTVMTDTSSLYNSSVYI